MSEPLNSKCMTLKDIFILLKYMRYTIHHVIYSVRDIIMVVNFHMSLSLSSYMEVLVQQMYCILDDVLIRNRKYSVSTKKRLS